MCALRTTSRERTRSWKRSSSAQDSKNRQEKGYASASSHLFPGREKKKRRKTITKTSSLCGIYTSGCCCVWDKDQESPSEPGRAAMRQTTPLSYTSSSKATDRLGSHTLSPRNLKRGIPVCAHSLSCSLHGLKPADGMSSKSVVKAP